MISGAEIKSIVTSLDSMAKALTRMAKAAEEANKITIDAERFRRQRDDSGRSDKPPMGIIGP